MMLNLGSSLNMKLKKETIWLSSLQTKVFLSCDLTVMVSELYSNRYSFTAKVTALLLSRGLYGEHKTVHPYKFS